MMSSWDEDETAASAAEAATTDIELLKRAWRNEKAAPEILRFDSPLVSRVHEQIQLLEETLDDFADSGVDDLVVSLYQMDLDRTLFLLRSYLRLRLQKIEKYTMHISRFDDLLSRLSPQERQFAKRYILTGTGICHNYLCQLVKLVGSDGNQLLVFHLAQVVRRSWRSIWSSLCCQNCHMVMTRLPGSRSRALKMWV